MFYKIIQPSIHLTHFIKDYLLLHFVFDKSAPVPVKPFPATTNQAITFYIRGNVTAFSPVPGTSTIFPQTAINGSILSRLDYSLKHNNSLLSVNFHPGALSKFLRLPLTEFVDERVDGEAVLNPDIHNVQERIINAESYESIIKIAEEYLWKRIRNLKTDFQPIDKVAQLMNESRHIIKIDKLASDACLSLRQFERRFIDLTGISPKLFMRINRFDKAYQVKDRNPNTDWLSVALEAGYYDYQHMVKDFKAFCNSTPQSLLDAQAKAPERILGLA